MDELKAPRLAEVRLENLIARLKPRVGEVAPGFFSAEVEDQAALRSRTAAGKGHLASAIRVAERALETGDREQIDQAAIICASYEDEGDLRQREAAERVELKEREARELVVLEARRKGGRARDAQQKELAARFWAPWQERFQRLRGADKSERDARSIVKNQMQLAGVGRSEPRYRHWLSDKKLSESQQ
jgi:hypothetical protein